MTDQRGTGMKMVNAHAITDRVRLLSHEIYAAHLRKDPSLVDLAREHALSAGSASLAERCWVDVLEEDLETIIRVMLNDGPTGRLLRSGSPFPLVIDVLDEELRRQLWTKAKADLEAEEQSFGDGRPGGSCRRT